MELTEHRCPRCGGELTQQSDTRWKCPYCGCTYDDETAAKNTASLHEALDEVKRELVNNARRNLYDAITAEYISSEDVKDACREIKKYLPDDFRANFYEIAADTNVKKTTKAIQKIDADKYYDDIENIVVFLIKSLQPYYLIELNRLIERSFQKRGDFAKYEKYSTELSIQAAKVQDGVYETMLHRDVFVAYSGKDMDKVSELVNLLEDNKISCFVAARNLRHGRGAVENYNKALEEAMNNCSVFVLISTPNSRDTSCDALTIEMQYIKNQDIANAPAEYRQFAYTKIPHEYKKPRVHFYAEKSKKETVADKIVNEFFDGHEWAYSPKEVLDRVTRQMLETPKAAPVPTPSKKQEEPKKICINCGHANEMSAAFCTGCGKNSFVNSVEEFVQIKNKRELDAQRAREEAQRRAEQAEADKAAAQKAAQEAKKAAAAPASTYSQPQKKKKKGGCLVPIIIIFALIVGAAVIIPELLGGTYEDVPPYDDPSTTQPIYADPGSEAPDYLEDMFPITGTLSGDISYEINSDRVITLSGSGELTDTISGMEVASGYGNRFSFSDIAKIVIDDGITVIGHSVFRDMPLLETVVLPPSVTEIYDEAFLYCQNLTEINLSSVKSIGAYTFSQCTHIASVDLSSIESIGDYAFYECSDLSTISCGTSLRNIGSYAFYNTEFYNSFSSDSPLYLGNILYKVSTDTNGRFDIPSNVTHIAPYAFYSCSQLTEIYIPSSVVYIGESAFYDAVNVSNIMYSGDQKAWEAIEKGENFDTYCGNNTNSNKYSLWCLGGGYDPGNEEPYTNGLSFKSDQTGSYAIVTGYSGSETSVVIPSNYLGLPVKEIAENAFYYSSITSIALPNTLTTIGYRAFYNSSLEAISVGDGIKLTNVSYDVLTNTPITSLASQGGCAVYIGNALVYVPDTYFESFFIAEGTTHIAQRAFYDHDSIYSVYVPSSVTSVGASAFEGASYIRYFIYGGSKTDVENIQLGNKVFDSCGSSTEQETPYVAYLNGNYDPETAETYTQGLNFTLNAEGTAFSVSSYSGTDANVTVPNKYFGLPVIGIGNSAFYDKEIVEISLPASIQSIEANAFNWCDQLTSIYVEEGSQLKSVHESALSNTPIINSITAEYPIYLGNCLVKVSTSRYNTLEIPNGVTSISRSALNNSNVPSVIIPESVTLIDYQAFYYAQMIKDIIYLGTEEQWNAITKGSDWDYQCGSYTENETYTLHFLNGEYDPSQAEGFTDGLFFNLDSTGSHVIISGYNGTDITVVVPSTFLGLPVEEIGNGAFSDKDIEAVILPSSIKKVGHRAFYYCENLVSISVPSDNNICSVGQNAFDYTPIKEAVSVDSPFYLGNCLVLISTSASGKLELPSGILGIADYAFADSSFTSVVIPESVTNIGRYAFSNAYYMDEIIYLGNQEQWDAIAKGTDWDYRCGYNTADNTYTLHCLDGAYTPDNSDPYTAGLQFTFIPESNAYKVSGYNGTDVNVVIPSNYMTAPVIGIANNAFSEKAVESVTIPNSITEIGYRAFYYSSLRSVAIPESVTTIGNQAFNGCSKLQTVEFADGIQLTTIPEYAFAACDLLTLEIPDSVETISANAFRENINLEYIKASENSALTTIGNYGFYDSESLNEVVLPASLVSVAGDAFSSSGSPTTITAPSVAITALPRSATVTLTIIGNGDITANLMSECSALETVIIKDGITSIGGSAFKNCDKLTSIAIASTVETIGQSAFYDCDILTSIVIPSGVSSIYASAFEGCDLLESVTLPASVETIGNNAFKSCVALSDIELPEGLTTLGTYAFNNCTALTSIEIPSTLTKIDNNAFSSSGLTSVVIPKTVSTLNSYAFGYCTSLVSLTLEDVVETMSTDAFYNDKLQSVTLPSEMLSKIPRSYLVEAHVTSGDIGKSAFSNCKSLRTVTLHDQIEMIGDSAFSNCTSLLSIELPATLISISNNAFSGCTAMAEIINYSDLNASSFAPENVLITHKGQSLIENVGDYVFITANSEYYLIAYVGKDAELTLPADYKGSTYIIRKNAFRERQDITSVALGGAKAIEDAAFYDCSKLVTLSIGSNVTSIGNDAFYSCESLKNVTFGSALKTIGARAFNGCSAITKLTFNSTIQTIGQAAFGNCSNLGSVIFASSTLVKYDITYAGNGSTYTTYSVSTNGADNATALKSTYYNYIWKLNDLINTL